MSESDNAASFEAKIENAFGKGAIIPMPGCVFTDRFYMRKTGLFYQPPANGDDTEPKQIWICSYFEANFAVRSVDGGSPEPGFVMRIKDEGGGVHEAVVLNAELQGDGVEVRRRLAGLGLNIGSSRRQREFFIEALSTLRPERKAWHTSSSGWKLDGQRFVIPGVPIGSDEADAPVFYLGRPDGAHYGVGGTMEGWRSEVAAPCIGNPILMYSVCAGLAGPLLTLIGAEGGGVHFVGSSSQGKSTALWLAASNWGAGGPNGYATTWRATGNAIEGVAAACNHTLLALDEMGRAEPDEVGRIAYGLADGQGKSRMRADGSVKRRAEWQVMILSTGEVSIETAMNEGRHRTKVRAGQEVRILSLAVDRGRGLGVIETHTGSAAARFAETLRASTLKHFGHAGPALVQALISNPALVERARGLADGFRERVMCAGDTGQVQRASWKFALPAAAGELAIELGLLPWPPGAAAKAAAELFEAWAASFGRSVEREARSAVEEVRYCLESMGSTAFWWHPGEEREDAEDAQAKSGGGFATEEKLRAQSRSGEGRTTKQLGYKSTVEGEGLVYLIHRNVMEKDVCPGRSAVSVARALYGAGYLLTNDHQKSGAPRYRFRKRTLDQPMSFYAVSARILGDVDDE